jgi:hypothetical protein
MRQAPARADACVRRCAVRSAIAWADCLPLASGAPNRLVAIASRGVRAASAPSLKFDPVPVFAVPVAVWPPAVCDDDAAGCFVVRGTAQQDAAQANRPALVKRGGKHACGVPLSPPRRDDVIADMASRFVGQLAVELVSDNQRAQVVLARDVLEHGCRNPPALFDAAPSIDESLEILTSRAQPFSVRTSQQAVGLLTDKVGRADGGDGPHQTGGSRAM